MITRVRTTVLVALVAALVSVISVSPADAQRVRPAFFGMHDSRVATGTLTTLPVGAVRLWDTGTSWRQIEKRKGRFDLRPLRTAVQTAEQAGARPLVVLGQTPRFHATKPRAPGAYGPGATSMPRLAPWKRYVATVARAFGTDVDYQVWNEPNVVGYWTGSVAQMAQLTAIAGRTIKHVAGRRATVVAPSFPLRLSSQQKWFRTYWHAKVGGQSVARFVDVVSANLYPLADQGPEASMNLLRVARRALPSTARHKPLWNTEINYGLLGGDTAKPIPARRQAAYVARTLTLNAGSSVGRVYWYAFGVGAIANTHLVGPDGTTLTRAGRAWAVTAGWLGGTRAGTCTQKSHGRERGVYTCVFRTSNEVRRVLWKPHGRPTRVMTPRTTRSWSTLSGSTTERTGSFAVQVGEVPVLVTSLR